MCGISGIVGTLGATSNRHAIEKMIACARHRGPDGEGVYEDRETIFGHNRLAILDLSEAGHQPMSTSDGRYTVTYNGEIYNYIELRNELTNLGHIFITGTDTEVLLRSYVQWGDECVHRFNGMWAFAIYDRERMRVFASRDRFGVKPFYYFRDDASFVFASEIRQILEVKNPLGVDDQAVADYLFAGFLDHSERTFFGGIKRLLGGHSLVVDTRDRTISISRWYELNEASAASDLLSLLQDSVRLRLRSDVKVGTCLSGGIDSSTVAILAAEAASTVSTSKFFSITAASGDVNDESKWASLVSEKGSLDAHVVKPSNAQFRESISELVRTQEEPFSGLSIFMQAFVMRKTSELGVKVLLDGQGGDEVFLGYPKYVQAVLIETLRENGFRAAIRLWKAVRKHNSTVSRWDWLKYIAKHLSARLGWIGPNELRRLVSRPWRNRSDACVLRYRRALSNSREIQKLDVFETNLPQLLRYEDKNSMRYSIETRLPFLDFRVVEFGLGLSGGLKLEEGWTKAPIRRSMRGRLPDAVLWRKDKIGFESPDAEWSKEFPELWRKHVAPSKWLRDIVPVCGKETIPGGLSLSSQWKLINLAMWHEMFFASPSSIGSLV